MTPELLINEKEPRTFLSIAQRSSRYTRDHSGNAQELSQVPSVYLPTRSNKEFILYLLMTNH